MAQGLLRPRSPGRRFPGQTVLPRRRLRSPTSDDRRFEDQAALALLSLVS